VKRDGRALAMYEYPCYYSFILLPATDDKWQTRETVSMRHIIYHITATSKRETLKEIVWHKKYLMMIPLNFLLFFTYFTLHTFVLFLKKKEKNIHPRLPSDGPTRCHEIKATVESFKAFLNSNRQSSRFAFKMLFASILTILTIRKNTLTKYFPR